MDPAVQVRTALQKQGLPAPSLAWIQNVLPNRKPMPPLAALVATARARLMAADIANASVLDPAAAATAAAALPANLSNPEVRELRLGRDVLVQVLDIDNLTKSKWEQVEELEAIARGEQTRGREIIRLPAAGEDDGNNNDDASYSSAATQSVAAAARSAPGANASAAPKNSTHRLVLQDCKGQKVYGLELKRMEKIGVATMNIGEKILLRKGATVARGIVLLDPATCTIMGGRVEAWQKAWLDGRLARLKESIES